MPEIHTIVINRGPKGLDGAGGGGGGAPTDAEYVVASASSGLSAERVLTAGAGVAVNTATPGQITVGTTKALIEGVLGLTGASSRLAKVAADGTISAGPPTAAELASGPGGSVYLGINGSMPQWFTFPAILTLGNGAGFAMEATKTAVQNALTLGTGLVKAFTNTISAALLKAADIAPSGAVGQSPRIAANGTDLEWFTPSAGGGGVSLGTGSGFATEATKAAHEAILGLGSGMVKAVAGALSAAALTKGDLASGGAAGQFLALDVATGNTPEWSSVLSFPNGAVVAGLGQIRGADNFDVYTRTQDNTANIQCIRAVAVSSTGQNLAFGGTGSSGVPSNTNVNGLNSAALQVSGINKIQALTSSLLASVASVQIDQAQSSPTVVHNVRASNAACTDLTIRAQAPNASATGTNRNPGSVNIESPSPTNGGTTRGAIRLRVDGADILTVTEDTTGTAELQLHSSLDVATAGASAGRFLRLKIGSTFYKIALLADA